MSDVVRNQAWPGRPRTRETDTSGSEFNGSPEVCGNGETVLGHKNLGGPGAFAGTDRANTDRATTDQADSDRANTDRGATVVEFSLVLPIILLFIFGITELGLGFKDYLSVSNASREGSRVASSAGNNPNADCAVLAGIANTLVTLDLDQVDRVEIYEGRQDGTGQDLTETNVYRYLAGDPMDCGNWAHVTTPFGHAERNTIVGPSQPLTIVGVKVVYEHDWITGMGPFNGTWTFERSTQSRVEPEAFES
jgi:hypothetical protein